MRVLSLLLALPSAVGFVWQLLLFESFGGFGKGVGAILWKAAELACGEGRSSARS